MSNLTRTTITITEEDKKLAEEIASHHPLGYPTSVSKVLRECLGRGITLSDYLKEILHEQVPQTA